MSQREHQKARTRAALVDAAHVLIRAGNEVTMPAIARAAGVSDATAYRHFPDLLSVLQEGLVGVWPDVADALPELLRSPDPIERIGMAAEFLGRNVLRIEGAVRAMIAMTITRPGATVGARPAYRLTLIEISLEPAVELSADVRSQLTSQLAIIVSAESLFTLLDLQRLGPEAAIATMVATAQAVVRAALGRQVRRSPRRTVRPLR